MTLGGLIVCCIVQHLADQFLIVHVLDVQHLRNSKNVPLGVIETIRLRGLSASMSFLRKLGVFQSPIIDDEHILEVVDAVRTHNEIGADDLDGTFQVKIRGQRERVLIVLYKLKSLRHRLLVSLLLVFDINKLQFLSVSLTVDFLDRLLRLDVYVVLLHVFHEFGLA